MFTLNDMYNAEFERLKVVWKVVLCHDRLVVRIYISIDNDIFYSVEYIDGRNGWLCHHTKEGIQVISRDNYFGVRRVNQYRVYIDAIIFLREVKTWTYLISIMTGTTILHCW